tara:strand:+ start:163 stop:567 length:405 start_codon:yes stop_codon:yes gene_type:complete
MSNQVTRETTIAQLISLGLIKASQIDTFNKRLNRKASKKADSELQARANQAVACYIGSQYGYGYENRFRKKPIEKALLKDGISRAMIDKAIKTMVEEGSLVNNSDQVANQCHTRHWRPEPVKSEAPESTESDDS